MLAAVGAQKRGLEALGLSHFLGSGPSPKEPRSGVPSASFESPRIPSAPGQQPASNATIPASSQQPANRKPNQRIPYARFLFTFPEDLLAPRDLLVGDLVFVHKTSQAMGRNYDRVTKCTGLPQLNAILADHRPGYTTLALGGPNDQALGSRVLKARASLTRYDILIAEADGNDDEKARLETELATLENPSTPPPSKADDLDPRTDWRAVTALSEWSPDGVLYGIEDETLETDRLNDARDDGVLLNVSIEGPTPMRNTVSQIEKTRSKNDNQSQCIDDRPIMMDTVFVGLVADEVDKGWSFSYKLFTGRQALLFADGVSMSQGPSASEFERLVTSWKIGRIMDTSAVADPKDRRVTVNVSISEWPMRSIKDGAGNQIPEDSRRRDLNWLQAEFGWRIGSAIA